MWQRVYKGPNCPICGRIRPWGLRNCSQEKKSYPNSILLFPEKEAKSVRFAWRNTMLYILILDLGLGGWNIIKLKGSTCLVTRLRQHNTSGTNDEEVSGTHACKFIAVRTSNCPAMLCTAV
jgi:hypothetical protein